MTLSPFSLSIPFYRCLFLCWSLCLLVVPGCGSLWLPFSIPPYFLLSVCLSLSFSLCLCLSVSFGNLPPSAISQVPPPSQWCTSAWWNGVALTTRKPDSSLLAFAPPSWMHPAVGPEHRDGMRRGVRMPEGGEEAGWVMEWTQDLIQSSLVPWWGTPEATFGGSWSDWVWSLHFPAGEKKKDKQRLPYLLKIYPSYLLTPGFEAYI